MPPIEVKEGFNGICEGSQHRTNQVLEGVFNLPARKSHEPRGMCAAMLFVERYRINVCLHRILAILLQHQQQQYLTGSFLC